MATFKRVRGKQYQWAAILASVMWVGHGWANPDLVSAQASASQVQVVKYLHPKKSTSSARKRYLFALLESLMHHTEQEYGPYKIEFIYANIPPSRKRLELLSAERINLLWTTDNSSFHHDLIRVPFPTMKGVLGNRILVINKAKQGDFDNVHTIDDLKQFKPGQGAEWSDVKIYKNNGFDVVTAPDMSLLFPMLAQDRYDFFPLGVNEVKRELALVEKQYPNLVLEQNLLIKYSLYVYFTVSPKEPVLAKRIRVGLEKIEENGEFDRLFNVYIQPELDDLKLDKRRVIQLKQ